LSIKSREREHIGCAVLAPELEIQAPDRDISHKRQGQAAIRAIKRRERRARQPRDPATV
jgi:hypothetical protein